ncbi:MAG: folate family ECF transporter S component [Clostridia bacterium]|nr:folate family ECF transporter S component [Clostridia bacterium]
MEQTKKLVVCAMLIALGVVLGGMLSIPAIVLGGYSVKIGFGVLPVIISGILYGPVYGGMVGGLTDLLQAVIFPKGAYEPWFTLVGVLFGLIPGLFFMKKQNPSFLRILLAVAAGQILGSVVCNSILMVKLYGYPWDIMIVRAINQVVMIPLHTICSYYILRLMSKAHITDRIRK